MRGKLSVLVSFLVLTLLLSSAGALAVETTWTKVGTSKESYGHQEYNETFSVDVSFRYVKVTLDNCYNDYSAVRMQGEYYGLSDKCGNNVPEGDDECCCYIKSHVHDLGQTVDGGNLKVTYKPGWSDTCTDRAEVYVGSVEEEPLADTMVDGRDNPDGNYGSHPEIGCTETDDGIYMKFDVSKFKDGNVALKFYVFDYWWSGYRKAEIYEVTDDSWKESDMTANNQPSWGSQLGGSIDTTSNGWYTVDNSEFQSYIKEEANGDGVASLYLDTGQGAANHYGIKVYSKEKSGYEPYLTQLPAGIEENKTIDKLIYEFHEEEFYPGEIYNRTAYAVVDGQTKSVEAIVTVYIEGEQVYNASNLIQSGSGEFPGPEDVDYFEYGTWKVVAKYTAGGHTWTASDTFEVVKPPYGKLIHIIKYSCKDDSVVIENTGSVAIDRGEVKLYVNSMLAGENPETLKPGYIVQLSSSKDIENKDELNVTAPGNTDSLIVNCNETRLYKISFCKPRVISPDTGEIECDEYDNVTSSIEEEDGERVTISDAAPSQVLITNFEVDYATLSVDGESGAYYTQDEFCLLVRADDDGDGKYESEVKERCLHNVREGEKLNFSINTDTSRPLLFYPSKGVMAVDYIGPGNKTEVECSAFKMKHNLEAEISPENQSGEKGETLVYKATITDNNPVKCPPQNYSISIGVQRQYGWEVEGYPSSINLEPKESTSFNFTVTSREDSQLGKEIIDLSANHLVIGQAYYKVIRSTEKIQLKEGWNLISASRDFHIKDIVDDCKIETYQNHQSWQYMGEWSHPQVIGKREGIFVYSSKQCTAKGLGERVLQGKVGEGEETKRLKEGWNMISVAEKKTLREIKGNCEIVDFQGTPLWAYESDLGWQRFGVSREMDPFKGYYIKVQDECELSFRASKPPTPGEEMAGAFLLGVRK